jgi:lipoyl(octanoyl) transferase
MILWCDGAHGARENMHRDARLLESASEAARSGRRFEATLRLFRFAPAGITLGHAQSPERTLDLERCRADGVEWAARPTGGRAIFHAEEWTYSIAAALSDPEWGGSLAEAYDRASRAICDSLVRLGVPATLAARGGPREGHTRAASTACFASTARHEVLLEGRKLVGSAQRRTAWALLQQGSVLLGPGHARLADYVALPADRREEVRAALAGGATDAGRWLGPDAPLERWARSLAESLGPRARVLHAAAGAFLLTPSEGRPYTPASPADPHSTHWEK